MVQLDLRFCIKCANHKNRHHDEEEDVGQSKRECRTEQCHRKDEQVKGVLDEKLRHGVAKKDWVLKKFAQLDVLSFILFLFVFFGVSKAAGVKEVALLIVVVKSDFRRVERGFKGSLFLGSSLESYFTVDILVSEGLIIFGREDKVAKNESQQKSIVRHVQLHVDVLQIREGLWWRVVVFAAEKAAYTHHIVFFSVSQRQ